MQNLSAEAGLTIGALAERTGLNVPTIRYYEEIGLIPAAKRRPSGHRFYDGEAEQLLTFVRHCRDFGFPIEQVRELVSLAKSEERDCFETRDIAQAQCHTSLRDPARDGQAALDRRPERRGVAGGDTRYGGDLRYSHRPGTVVVPYRAGRPP